MRLCDANDSPEMGQCRSSGRASTAEFLRNRFEQKYAPTCIQSAIPSVLCPARGRNSKLSVGKKELVMRKTSLLLAVALAATASTWAAAQAPPAASTDRKVATRVAPTYPELAKRMHIRGVVRIEAIVRPNGAVKSTRVLGGNPVLVDAAQEAVGKWKFEPTQAETTELVQLTFDGQ